MNQVTYMWRWVGASSGVGRWAFVGAFGASLGNTAKLREAELAAVAAGEWIFEVATFL